MLDVYDSVGFLGAAIIIIAYWRLQRNKLDPAGFLYSFLNLLSAALVITSLLGKWNVAAFVIEVFWLAISLFGLIKYFRARKRTA